MTEIIFANEANIDIIKLKYLTSYSKSKFDSSIGVIINKPIFKNYIAFI